MRIKKVRTQKMPCEPKKNGNGLLRLFLHSSRLSLHTSEELPPGLSVVLFVVNSEILLLLSGKTREGIKYQSEALKNQVSDLLFQKVSPLSRKVFVPEVLLEPLLLEYYSKFYPDFP